MNKKFINSILIMKIFSFHKLIDNEHIGLCYQKKKMNISVYNKKIKINLILFYVPCIYILGSHIVLYQFI